MDRSARRIELIHLFGSADRALIEVTEELSDEQFNSIYRKLLNKINLQEIELQIQSKIINDIEKNNLLLPRNISLVVAEIKILECALQTCHGNISKAAKQLGIGRKTLHCKINKYGLSIQ